ncbi:MAG: phosphonate transport system ATP-binding protein [Chloroflexi bacterium]|nr:MAG: phosphonate transport system ATP-binding protein [Chloroflexota bacterium]
MSLASLESSRTEAAQAVSLSGLSKAYGPIEALAPLSLTVAAGETVAILGPSGSGKTTLLLLLSGQLGPSSGAVTLVGREIAQLSPGKELAQLVGMIHQQFDLVPNISALHNVLAGRLGEWGLFKSLVSLVWPQDRPMGMEALARVGVADRAELRAGRLSGGEQQRVAIARLLLQDPAIVLADEPVASLDQARAGEVIRLLVRIARDSGKTLISSMHSVELARAHFDRLIGLRNGIVQFDLPSSQVADDMLLALYDIKGLRRED